LSNLQNINYATGCVQNFRKWNGLNVVTSVLLLQTWWLTFCFTATNFVVTIGIEETVLAYFLLYVKLLKLLNLTHWLLKQSCCWYQKC